MERFAAPKPCRTRALPDGRHPRPISSGALRHRDTDMHIISERSHSMARKIPITVAKGDGIGPEIMDAVLHILNESGAPIEPEFIDIGEKVYLAGKSAGIADESWESLRRTKVFLKGPITTPQGGGYKSLNVTTRKVLGLYANVRPAVAYHPYVPTKYPGMNVVVVRENEEDLYAGIEHQQTPQVDRKSVG